MIIDLRRTSNHLLRRTYVQATSLDTNSGVMICVGLGNDVDAELFASAIIPCPTHMVPRHANLKISHTSFGVTHMKGFVSNTEQNLTQMIHYLLKYRDLRRIEGHIRRKMGGFV